MDAHVRRSGPGHIEVTVLGEVDLASAGALTRSLRGAAEQAGADVLPDRSQGAPRPGRHDRVVTVDLAGVGFLDSSGVRALLKGRVAAQAAGAVLAVRDPQPAVRRVLEITGLDRVLGLVDRWPAVADDTDAGRSVG